jgi:ankyrin repeat protein
MYAVRSAADNGDVVECLLQAKADPNATDIHGRTALHYAAQSGFEQCVRSLLAAEANMTIKDEDDKTALDYGASYPSIVELLSPVLPPPPPPQPKKQLITIPQLPKQP